MQPQRAARSHRRPPPASIRITVTFELDEATKITFELPITISE
jgi:hypothetical protein